MMNINSQLKLKNSLPWIVISFFIVLMVLQLNTQGRFWLPASGELKLWINDAWGSETSQHLFDPYSFSHVEHGIIFFGLFYLLLPKGLFAWKFALNIILEGLWELLENSSLIIDRYREATAALGYTGDTIINSIGDLVSCGIGFFLANALGLKKSVIFMLIVEIVMLLTIRDCLLLNIVMLIYPISSIKTWQLG